MNILIATLSTIHKNMLTQYTYDTVDEGTITGYFASEASCRYLIRKLWDNRYSTFDKIIVLSTGKCAEVILSDHVIYTKRSDLNEVSSRQNIKNVEGLTTEQYFREIILDEMKKVSPENAERIFHEGSSELFEFINTDETDQKDLLKNIQKQSSDELEANLYVDLTGGSRVQSLIATMVVAWLEALNYTVECVVYANINKNPHTIDDITATYQLVNAVVANAKRYDAYYRGITEDQDIISLSYNLRDIKENNENQMKMDRISPPYTGDEPYIFLSYAHKDKLPAQAILKHLIRDGYRVWYDEGIETGEEWEKKIYQKMNDCEFALVLLSNKYLNDSTFCAEEIEFLLQKDIRRVYMVRLDNVESKDIPADFEKLKENFEKVQFLDFQAERLGSFYKKLMEFLDRKAANCRKKGMYI